jgi:hypothetical protein
MPQKQERLLLVQKPKRVGPMPSPLDTQQRQLLKILLFLVQGLSPMALGRVPSVQALNH